MFPPRLDAPQAYAIAHAMLEGVDRHYQLFRAASQASQQRFEASDWGSQQRAQRERIAFYDQRVQECVQRLTQDFAAGSQPMLVWQQVKLHYIGLMVGHLQPELAETFFNSVTTKILHRTHFHNDFIFVRPAVSTEYLESVQAPVYRAYYPGALEALPATLAQIVTQFGLRCHFQDLSRDSDALAVRVRQRLQGLKLRANFQIQVLGIVLP
jgi:isocitrate dehydrogenase kinase/phosphatase